MSHEDVVVVVDREDGLLSSSRNNNGRNTVVKKSVNGGSSTVCSAHRQAQITVEGNDITSTHCYTTESNAGEQSLQIGSIRSNIQADTEGKNSVRVSGKHILSWRQFGRSNN